MVPGDAPLVVLVRDLHHLTSRVELLGTLLGPVAPGIAPAALRRRMRQRYGLSLLDQAELQRAGVNPRGNAALYHHQAGLNLVLTVGDDTRLRQFLKRKGLAATFHHGLASIGMGGKQPAVPAADNLHGSDALASLLRQVGSSSDLLVLLRPAPFNRATSRANTPRCQRFDRGLADFTHISGGVALESNGASVALVAELSPTARASLTKAMGPPLSLPPLLWDEALARAHINLHPHLVSRVAHGLPTPAAGCGVIADTLATLRLARIARQIDPLSYVGGRVTAAAHSADPDGRRVRLRAAAVAGMPNSAVRRLLAFLVGGPWARWEKVAGRTVQKVNAPSLISGSVRLHLGDDRIRATAGEGLMAKFFQRVKSPPNRGLLLEARLDPRRLGLSPLVDTDLLRRLRQPREAAKVLERFERLSLTVALESRGLRVKAAYRLPR